MKHLTKFFSIFFKQLLDIVMVKFLYLDHSI